MEYVDYKDTEMLRKFISERAKLKARRVSGNSEKQQREVARAVKNAREMALIPYANRVTTQRRDRRNDERGQRADGPPPRPSGPPPGLEAEAVDDEALVDADVTAVDEADEVES